MLLISVHDVGRGLSDAGPPGGIKQGGYREGRKHEHHILRGLFHCWTYWRDQAAGMPPRAFDF